MIHSLLLLALFLPLLGRAEQFYVYVGAVEPRAVLLAWGTTGGGNTIGRNSTPHGRAEIRINGRTIAESQRNWVRVNGLQPDREYRYEVRLNGQEIGAARVRTWPEKADRLAFFVIGDWGNGSDEQYDVAAAMTRTFERWAAGSNPIRFVITTGDNIYADRILWLLRKNSGDKDSHWKKKFFRPYEELLRSIPFYPSLGNHDGDESESAGDLAVYLDNFFFPAPEPSRYYHFGFGGLAEFFSIDSTNITTQSGQPIYEPDGQQHRWLEHALTHSQAPWKIPYFHHPPFNAGPGHPAYLDKLKHFMELFGRTGVKVAFNGHEHNFQWTESNDLTRGVRYVISGAGGSLRDGDVSKNLKAANIEAWAPENHFLLVEIERSVMRIHVLGPRSISIRDSNGNPAVLPFEVTL